MCYRVMENREQMKMAKQKEGNLPVKHWHHPVVAPDLSCEVIPEQDAKVVFHTSFETAGGDFTQIVVMSLLSSCY